MTRTTIHAAVAAPAMRSCVGAALLCALTALAAPATAQIVNTLRGFEDEPGWQGRLEATLATADGSVDYYEFDLGAAVQYQTGRNRARLLANRMRRDASGVLIADNTLLHLRHNYGLTDHLATLLFVQLQQNPFRSIEERTLLGVGLRVDIVTEEQFNVLAGAAYMREYEVLTAVPADSVVNRHRASVYASVLGKPREGVQLDLSAFYQPVVDDPSNERTFVSAAIRVDIVGGLYFTTGYMLLHDSLPPPGVPETDQYLRSGLGYEF